MKTWVLAVCAAVSLGGTPAFAAPPAAIFTDPPADVAHPARSEVLQIPSGGLTINGLAYIPPGARPHPVVVLLHGYPGNEKNLDLAQAIRRAGWTVVTFNYRGSWGSPGTFGFRNDLADAKAVLAYLRTPAVAATIQGDPTRMVMMGHSLGGWVTAVTASPDKGLIGAALISAADMSTVRSRPMEERVTMAASNMVSLAGVTAQSMADELTTLTDAESFAAAAPGLTGKPLLVLTADDGLAGVADGLVAQIRKAGGTKVTAVHAATDHSWNSARIQLETEVINWLAALPK
jgi:pimeloyl-ACP methyl ester carboxylesterase